MESMSVSRMKHKHIFKQLLNEPFPSSVCGPVFGKVIEGMNVVQYIENVPKGGEDRPLEAVVIKDSGVL